MKTALKTLPIAVPALAPLGAGTVTHDVIGQPLHMAGTMTVLDAHFGDPVEYDFSAGR
jgi:hypothetical protein